MQYREEGAGGDELIAIVFLKPPLQGLHGTAVFVREDLDHKVSYGLGVPKHDGEGRTITVELNDMFVVGLYVPNTGKVEASRQHWAEQVALSANELFTSSGVEGRLDYRLKEWNPDLLAYVKRLEQTKPVIVTGDLNVAHLDHDIYNVAVSLRKVLSLGW